MADCGCGMKFSGGKSSKSYANPSTRVEGGRRRKTHRVKKSKKHTRKVHKVRKH